MNDSKKDVWTIKANVTVSYLTTFTEPVTKDEAKELFLKEEYEDILNEEGFEIAHVISVSE